MEFRHFNIYFFFAFLLVVGIGVVFLFLPFFSAIIIASILAVFFRHPYQWLLKETHGSVTTSALLTCFLVALVIVVPVFVSLSFAMSEVSSLYAAIGAKQSAESVFEIVGKVPFVGNFLHSNILNPETFSEDIQAVSKNALGLLQAAYQGVAHFFFWIFVVFFSLYYFLTDSERALKYLMRMSPLRDEHDQLLIKRFVSISRATIKGTLFIGVIQGTIGGLVFWIAGVPSALIWGMVMVFFSVIPMVGSGIIWFPAGIILLLLGNIWQGLFVLGVGVGVISTIDNILRPKLVGQDTHMHPLLVFFATLGGLSLFGLLGFIIGPIIVALFLALSEIYMKEFHRQLKSYNEAKTGA